MGAGAPDRQIQAIFWIVACLIFPDNLFAVDPPGIEPVISKSGLVVAGHPEAAQIGATVLRQGGNAIDAVVATGFALGVAEPYGSGIGGK